MPVTGLSRDPLGPGEERRGEENQERVGEGLTAPEDGPDVWYFVVGRYPNRRDSQALYDWLTRLCDDFGVVRLWEVMRMCYAQERNKATLLSRTEAVLSRDAARLDAIRFSVGSIIAASRPSFIAIARNMEFTSPLLGRPNETLESPHIVLTFPKLFIIFIDFRNSIA